MKYIALAILALAVGAVALADCRVVQIRAVRHHVAPVVAVEAHAAYSYYPSYSVGYAPDLTEIVKALIEDNKQMREALIQQLRAGPGAPIMPLVKRHPGLDAMNAKCASCHSTETKAKGNGVAFLNAGQYVGDAAMDGKIAEQLDPDQPGGPRMPKGSGGKITDRENLSIHRFITVKE